MPGEVKKEPQKIFLDIRTKKSTESYEIPPDFTGKVIFDFNFGGLANVFCQQNLRVSIKLK